MKKNYRRSFYCLFVTILASSFSLEAQDLLKSPRTSPFTYIYKITDKEAEIIYKKSIWEVDTSFFHTLVDSFETDEQYTGKLPPGHYLKTWAESHQQKLSIATIHNLNVFILNNNTDLCLQVYDLNGDVITDADLKIGWKNLRFDKDAQAFIDKKSNKQGILKVTCQGMTSFFLLERDKNNSALKRGFNKTVYSFPLRYAWRPVRFVIKLPIDGVRSIVRGWPEGTIWRTVEFAKNTFFRVACLFDDYYCDEIWRRSKKYDYEGYLVFNKPKYLPGDTVKFKAFVVNGKGKPIDKEVKVILYDYNKSTELTRLNPYREGAYSWEFVIDDSLDLRLDKRINLSLVASRGNQLMSGSFYYEDYELKNINLSHRMEKKSHFRGQDQRVFIKGTDENDLNLLDARVEVLIKPDHIYDFFSAQEFVPDTLLFTEQMLNPSGETEIVIPDSIFPSVNMDYLLGVRLLTSDNKEVTDGEKMSFYHKKNDFEIDLTNDFLSFDYRENGIMKSVNAKVYGQDNFGNKHIIFEGLTPSKVELNPYFKSYLIESGSHKDSVDISRQPSLIQCYSDREGDSLSIIVNNPRGLQFNYDIYKRNKPVRSGITDSLNFSQRTISKKNYYISLRYLWGGVVKEETYEIPLLDKKMKVLVDQPRMVYPGQEASFEILVTDHKGKPVKGADVTAYAMTKKFDYNPPTLPYLGKERKGKELINNFKFDPIVVPVHPGLRLDYEKWKALARLDSIEFYKFIYPEKGLYKFEYVTSDTLTQFAPFVVSKGERLPVHVIYVDSKPVYFSWSTNIRPYSFGIGPGFHQVRLRTSDGEITIDSMYFEKGKKLIFSIDKDFPLKNVRMQKESSELSKYEKNLLHRYIFPYRKNFGNQYAYLKYGSEIQFLESYGRRYGHTPDMVGPVYGKVEFKMIDSFSIDLIHEPYYEYFFAPELLKMRSVDQVHYPEDLSRFFPKMPLTDEVLNEKDLLEQWQQNREYKRRVSQKGYIPVRTEPGKGRVRIKYKDNDQEVPLDILLWYHRDDNFLRVYSGHARDFHDLKEGYYKLMFMYPGSHYHLQDSIYVKPDGLTYWNITIPEQLKKDAFSIGVDSLIYDYIFKKPAGEKGAMEAIKDMHRHTNKYLGIGRVIRGQLMDANGEALIGASILVKGTSTGTVTDFDGFYEITIPPGSEELVFSYTGFESQEVSLGNSDAVDVVLNEGAALEEVVVTALGIAPVKRNLASSVTSVKSDNIIGYGKTINALSGKVAGITVLSENGQPGGVEITIRGSQSLVFNDQPLYIIDGAVFTGDITTLDPGLINKMQVLKDESATALYGMKASNGVVIIETRDGNFRSPLIRGDKGADFDEAFLTAASNSGAIRDNFSDYAFWQPRLKTDKEGKARFSATFPDDVTSWKTYYLVMNSTKQSGQSSGEIKSYKPLMGQLAVPRFLVEGDSCQAIGKVLNYMPDSMELTTQFEINEHKQFSKVRMVKDAIVDNLPLVARGQDTLSVKYFLEKIDGYLDGEQRDVPVFPKGIEKAIGQFWVLEKDTTYQLEFDPDLGPVTMTAKTDLLRVVQEEAKYLIHYKYDCNEQLASKLKALLVYKKIAEQLGNEFEYEKHIPKIIRLLEKNRKPSGLWGWWKESRDNYWISFHVLEAMLAAKKQGYRLEVEVDKIKKNLIWQLENSNNFSSKVRMLKMLKLLGSTIAAGPYIDSMEVKQELSFHGLLQVMHLKQLYHLDYDLDTVEHFRDTTIYGNIYFGQEVSGRNILVNDLQNTLLVYKILRADSLDHSSELGKIRNYFLEKRQHGRWGNTYASARVIETILPDLLGDTNKLVAPTLKISGDIDEEVTEFPFTMTIEPDVNVTVSKSGNLPVYFSSFQHFWEKKPEVKKQDFEITTSMETDTPGKLEAGVPTRLKVKLNVKKDADYVMINIPIPAGCSYGEKKKDHWLETHREYFKHETAIFCEDLPKGNYKFEIELMPRFTGVYTINPAKVELMYFPVFYGNNELKKVEIK